MLINRKIKKLKKYMDEKQKMIDDILSKINVMDKTINLFNIKINNTLDTIDKLKDAYENKINELNNKIELLNSKKDIKIAVIIHLYYIDLWDDFNRLLNNINYETDIYINLVDNSMYRLNLINFKKRVEYEKPNCKVFINENVGLDIGGSLFMIKHILEEEKEYDYILKLHTKKGIHEGRINNNNGNKWREELIEPILGDYKKVNDIIDIFTENPLVGMIGSKKWLLNKTDNIYQNSDKLKDYMNMFNIKYPLDEIQYIGGTMFWVRFDIIKEFFENNNIDKVIRTFEKNSFTDNRELRWTHAFERVFGLMVLDKGKKIIGV